MPEHGDVFFREPSIGSVTSLPTRRPTSRSHLGPTSVSKMDAERVWRRITVSVPSTLGVFLLVLWIAAGTKYHVPYAMPRPTIWHCRRVQRAEVLPLRCTFLRGGVKYQVIWCGEMPWHSNGTDRQFRTNHRESLNYASPPTLHHSPFPLQPGPSRN